jgi:hypothetical protein
MMETSSQCPNIGHLFPVEREMPSSQPSISLPPIDYPGLLGFSCTAFGTYAACLRRRAAVGGFSGLTWIANLLTFLGAVGQEGGVGQPNNTQQGQGFARYREGEGQQVAPTLIWTAQLTCRGIRDLYIDT